MLWSSKGGWKACLKKLSGIYKNLKKRGNVLQKSGGSPFLQTAVIDFERVTMLRNQGVAGVSHPWKDFRKNNQSFEVYNKKTKT